MYSPRVDLTDADQRGVLQLVSRVSRGLVRRGDAALRPLGLHYAQIPVLALLREPGTYTQSCLAERAGVEQPSMAQLLARMRRDGLIHHEPHPNDGRSQTIVLSEPEDPKLDEARHRLEEIEAEAMRGFSPTDFSTLQALLLRILENLQAQPAHQDQDN